MLDPIQLSFVLLLAAALSLYVGTRLLWASIPTAGLWRGVIFGGPLILMALGQAVWSPAAGVALLMAAAVLALTLGIGVSMIDVPDGEAGGSPVLRTLLPLSATVCLCGFRGELTWPAAVGIAVVGGMTLWTADAERRRIDNLSASPLAAIPAVVLIVVGLCVLAASTWLFRRATGAGASTPVVVLLTAPAILLALLGLLTAEARQHHADTPQETATGLAIACLGIGLPLVILLATFKPMVHTAAAAAVPTTLPASDAIGDSSLFDAMFAAAGSPGPLIMPLSTWRVDSVMLVVVSILLLPIGAGRFRLGRAEGALFIVLYLAYAAVATRTGSLTG